MRAKVEAANDALTRFLMPGGDRSIERLEFAVQMVDEAIGDYNDAQRMRHEQLQMANKIAYGGTI